MSPFRPLLSLALACLALPLAAGERRPLALDDLYALATLSEPRISPDGTRVAYLVETLDQEKDEAETALWMIRADGGEPWRLTAPGTSASRPRWRPDGAMLAFLAERASAGEETEPETQVWAFDLRGGDAKRLTAIPQGVLSYDFSPDGTRLLLTIRDPEPEDLLDAAARKKARPRPHVIDRRQFKRDGRGYLDRRRDHLYVYDLATQRLDRLTAGDYDHSDAVWSPDGTRVAFTSNRTADPDGNSNTDLWVIDVAGADRAPRRLTTNPGPDHTPVWRPDGRALAYLTATDVDLMWYATVQLATVPATGGEPRILTAHLDRHASAPRFAPDGDAILFLLEDSATQHLARVPATGGAVERQVAGERSILDYSVDAAGTVAALVSEPHLPQEVFLHDAGGLRRLTHANRALLAEVRLGEVRNVHFRSADGTPIEGFLTLPPGHREGERHPAILWLHGGPVAQYDVGFDFQSQLFAARGYVVIRPNPRGSSGYGQDFSAAIFADWGNKDYDDAIAAVDDAIARGVADPARLGVGGWSYGGILTNYVITKTDRFEAAVSGSSEVHYAANYGHDHYQLEWEQELGLPWENRALWERLSPWSRVEKIVTPTLILCGEDDWNVPVLNSEQLYQALKRLGRTTELVVYPGESHAIERPSFRRDRLERYLAWLDRHVKNAPPAPAPAAGDGGMIDGP